MEQNTLRRRGVGLRGVDHSRTSNGYTLICPLTSDVAHLIDTEGREVHSWKLPGRIGRHARILPNGNLAVNTIDPDRSNIFPFFNKYGGGVMSELSPSGKVIRQHRDALGHHDAYHYPDGSGRILYTSLEKLSPEEGAQVIGGVPGSEAPGDGFTYTDLIKEVDCQGKLLWSWSVKDSLLPREKFALQPHYTREHYPLINAVYPLADGNILASMRSISHVVIISRATGKIIWDIGPDVVAQQHCANELPNGNILIFDNGAFRTGESAQFSRTIEVDRETKKIVWEYRDKSQMVYFFTPFMGSAQRLGNGNTLLCESAFGRVFEVTREGQVVWEYVNEWFAAYADDITSKLFPGESNALFRAYRYSLEEIPWLKEKLEQQGKAVNGVNGAH